MEHHSEPIRECKYAKNAKNRYDNGEIDETELIEVVWHIAKQNSKRKLGVVEESTKGFLKLTEERGQHAWIDWHFHYFQNRSNGLWPWLDSGSDIIEEAQSPNKGYRVRVKFYDALCRVVNQTNVLAPSSDKK